MSPFRERRQLLILLGLVCMGFSFDNYWMPVVYAGLWGLALCLRRERRVIPMAVEALVLVIGIPGAYYLGGVYDENKLVFIGNALVVFQLLRLLGPLTPREKRLSITVALMHLAVGSQVVVDYKFLLVLAGSLVLLPGALFELDAERFRRVTPGRLALDRRLFVALAVLMAAFFLAFPRMRIIGSAAAGLGGGRRQPEEIDTSASGGSTSDRLVFRLEGEDVDYLKTSCLDTFNGRTWQASHYLAQAVRSTRGEAPPEAKYRRVRVASRNILDTTLPTDGHVARVAGAFYQRPYVAEHGGVVVPVKPRRRTDYDYWTMLGPVPTPLTPKQRARYLGQRDDSQTQRLGEQPPPSAALRQWLDQVIGDARDPRTQADAIMVFLRQNFRYNTGAPVLDRVTPVDDFVFNQQEGHCERFASVLAYLLRLQGIPSRVALGYMAAERNDLAGIYNIRVKHGHAWTEAHFPETGWVTLDATPHGGGFELERRGLALTVAEWVEYTWYSRIVEFDVIDQNRFFNFVGGHVGRAASGIFRQAHLLIGLLLTVSAGVLLWRARGLFERGQAEAAAPERSLREVRNFYGRMLKELARQRFPRAPSQTPREFLRAVERVGHVQLDDIRLVTEDFCRVRYGDARLSRERRICLAEAISRIAAARRQARQDASGQA